MTKMNGFDDYMQQVLQRPQYDVLTGRRPDLGELIWDTLLNFLEWLFGHLYNILPAQAPRFNLEIFAMVFIIVAAVLAILALSGLIYLIYTRRRKRKAQAARNELVGWFDDIGNKRLNRANLLRRARESAAAGDMQNAVRHRYLALLILLNERKFIVVDRFKTNAQLSEEISKNAPHLSEQFVLVVDIFHEAWFGRRTITMERYLEFDKIDSV